jgi:tRNA U34 5-carboxymethylaminomethyl modifying enzyme MnmG/GidA
MTRSAYAIENDSVEPHRALPHLEHIQGPRTHGAGQFNAPRL